jgi:hypothetical protein
MTGVTIAGRLTFMAYCMVRLRFRRLVGMADDARFEAITLRPISGGTPCARRG